MTGTWFEDLYRYGGQPFPSTGAHGDRLPPPGQTIDLDELMERAATVDTPDVAGATRADTPDTGAITADTPDTEADDAPDSPDVTDDGAATEPLPTAVEEHGDDQDTTTSSGEPPAWFMDAAGALVAAVERAGRPVTAAVSGTLGSLRPVWQWLLYNGSAAALPHTALRLAGWREWSPAERVDQLLGHVDQPPYHWSSPLLFGGAVCLVIWLAIDRPTRGWPEPLRWLRRLPLASVALGVTAAAYDNLVTELTGAPQ